MYMSRLGKYQELKGSLKSYCVPKAPEGEKAVLDMVRDEKWVGAVNRAVDTTIGYGLRTIGDDLDKLCDRVLSGSSNIGDKMFHNSHFLETMTKAQEAAAAEKQQEQAKALRRSRVPRSGKTPRRPRSSLKVRQRRNPRDQQPRDRIADPGRGNGRENKRGPGGGSET
jgi:hypothetical protein